MDDCSGNRIGRHLLRGYYFNKMPKELALDFKNNYNVDPDHIKNNLYKKPNPNAYLATFAKFLIKHKETDFCKQIIKSEMKDFVENYILQYDNSRDLLVHFVGSIAFYSRYLNCFSSRGCFFVKITTVNAINPPEI